MPTIPEAIISDRTSLITPGSNIPAGDNPKTLVRYNIRLAAEEDPELAAHVLDWQAGVDPFGHSGCYDDARPELACPQKRGGESFWEKLRIIALENGEVLRPDLVCPPKIDANLLREANEIMERTIGKGIGE